MVYVYQRTEEQLNEILYQTTAAVTQALEVGGSFGGAGGAVGLKSSASGDLNIKLGGGSIGGGS